MSLLFIAALALGASGCPDQITDPGPFLDVNLSETPPSDSPVVANCPLGAMYVETQLLPTKCAISGCHSAVSPQNNLNLAGTDAQLAMRLVGTQGSSSCGHTAWIDPTNAAQSLIVQKVTSTPPCGSRMPIGSTLSAMEIQCLTSWAEALSASSVGADGGGDMDSATGTDAGHMDAGGMAQ